MGNLDKGVMPDSRQVYESLLSRYRDVSDKPDEIFFIPVGVDTPIYPDWVNSKGEHYTSTYNFINRFGSADEKTLRMNYFSLPLTELATNIIPHLVYQPNVETDNLIKAEKDEIQELFATLREELVDNYKDADDDSWGKGSRFRPFKRNKNNNAAIQASLEYLGKFVVLNGDDLLKGDLRDQYIAEYKNNKDKFKTDLDIAKALGPDIAAEMQSGTFDWSMSISSDGYNCDGIDCEYDLPWDIDLYTEYAQIRRNRVFTNYFNASALASLKNTKLDNATQYNIQLSDYNAGSTSRAKLDRLAI